MDVIRRKINLKPFTERVFGSESILPNSISDIETIEIDGVVTDIVKDILYEEEKTDDGRAFDVETECRHLPVAENCEGHTVVRWDTFVKYYRFLINFIIESLYYTIAIRKNGEEDVLKLVPVIKYSCDEPEDERTDFEILKDYFLGAVGVYSDVSEAISDTENVNKDNCKKIVVINSNAQEFFNLYPDGICSVKAFLKFISDAGLSENPFVEIPITLFSDVKEMGPAEVYTDYWKPGETYSKGCVVYWYGDDDELYAYKYKNLTPASANTFVSEEWEKLVCYDKREEEGEDEEENDEKILVESKLKTLKRSKRSYDSKGNELPYYENADEDGRKEMLYMSGIPMNIVYEDDGCKYNVIKHIKYLDVDGNEQEDVPDGTYYDNGILDENGIVEFTYLVGADAEKAVDTEDCGGIEYIEKRYYTVSGRVNDSTGYIVISDESVDSPDLSREEGVSYAVVDKSELDCKEPISCNEFLIRGGAFMDIQEIRLNSSAVDIERGTSASYEAFNVLGEMNTIEDVEKYRDDWFRIKGKND